MLLLLCYYYYAIITITITITTTTTNNTAVTTAIDIKPLILLKREELLQLVHCVEGVLDGVTNDGGMIENFKVVSTLGSFITEKVNFTEIEGLQVAQTESFVPSLREGVNWDLPSDRVLQAVIGEFRFEGFDEVGTDGVGLVEGFKFQALLVGTIATDRGNVNHGIAEFDETAALDRNIKIGNVF